MNTPEDMLDVDRDSEFNSEDEEIEFQLYQQLYFEPNPDITEVVPTAGQLEPETCGKQSAQPNGSQPCQVHDPNQKLLTNSTTDSEIKENQTSKIENCIYIDTEEGAELTLADFTVQLNAKQTEPHASADEVSVSDNTKSRPQQKELHVSAGHEVSISDNTLSCPQQTELHASAGHEVSVSDNVPLKRSNAVPLQSVRERLSSTCSDGSIPGRVPLDGLYCNLATSDEDDDDITIIEDRLAMKDLGANKQEMEKEKGEANSNKRKRRKTNSDDEAEDSRCNSLISAASKPAVSKDDKQEMEKEKDEANSNKRKRRKTNSDDEAEDSRCNSLISAASKPTVSKDDTNLEGYDSSPDDDIFVLPPPKPRNPEILTIESSSDSEVEAGNSDTTCIRTKDNKKRRIESPQASTSRKDGKSKTKHQTLGSGEKQGRKEEKEWESIESDSDTNDVDLPEATKGTDLTLNIDKSLSGWVKTITKDPVTLTNKRKAMAKKPYNKNNRHSLDYTKGRPDTTTPPSCTKWTQSMANFYDSDVSDDLDVTEVHSQQSDSAANWHLVAADYQITQRRRYYNAPERCKQCKQEGHTTSKCPRVPVCHMCSGKDHCNRRDCPQNCCFRCGGEPHFFCPATNQTCVCHLCGYPGHHKDLCPDLWRRFHLTTNGLIAQVPSENGTRPSRKRYCFNCGKRGHYGHECPIKFQNRFYPQVSQSVVSYCSPVNLVDGQLVVNLDGTRSTSQEGNVTTLPIKPEDVGRIIGKKGAIVKLVIKDSGAHVRVIQEGQPKIMLFGPPEARLKAQEIIESLISKRNEFMKPLSNEFMKPLSNNNSGSSTPMTSGISESTSLTVSTSNSIENSPWCQEFLDCLDRSKAFVLKNISKLVRYLNYCKERNLRDSVNRLKSFKKCMDSNLSIEIPDTIIWHLSALVMRMVGSQECGEGAEMYQKITSLHQQVKNWHSQTLPEGLCVEIARTVEYVHNPSIERLDELLQYGKRFLEKKDQKKKEKEKKKRKFKRLLKIKKASEKNVRPNENKNISITIENKVKKKSKMKNQKGTKKQCVNAGKIEKTINKTANAGKTKKKNNKSTSAGKTKKTNSKSTSSGKGNSANAGKIKRKKTNKTTTMQKERKPQ